MLCSHVENFSFVLSNDLQNLVIFFFDLSFVPIKVRPEKLDGLYTFISFLLLKLDFVADRIKFVELRLILRSHSFSRLGIFLHLAVF